jgi:tRNA wybutosine-synthesizing protein 4
VFATYEQIRPADPFGRTMVKNLEARGCPLLGIHAYPDLASQQARYTSRGWHVAASVDMNAALTRIQQATPGLAQRLATIEIFDELEEWTLIQAHYCITVAATAIAAATFWGQSALPPLRCRLGLPPLHQKSSRAVWA